MPPNPRPLTMVEVVERLSPAEEASRRALAEVCRCLERKESFLDRLTHHVHILEMNGESFRLNHSRARKMAPAG